MKGTGMEKLLAGKDVIRIIANSFGLSSRRIRRVVLDASIDGAAVLYVEEYPLGDADTKADLKALRIVSGTPAVRVEWVGGEAKP